MKSALLVAMCIGLAGCDMGLSNQRADKQGETVIGQVKARSEDAVCRSNLSQVRAAIAAAKTDGSETNPTSLSELRLPESMLKDPIGDEPYLYDSATGTVKCPHPGHAKY